MLVGANNARQRYSNDVLCEVLTIHIMLLIQDIDIYVFILEAQFTRPFGGSTLAVHPRWE